MPRGPGPTFLHTNRTLLLHLKRGIMTCNKIPINDLVHDVAQLKHVSIQSSRLDCSKTFVDTIAIHKFKITSKLEEAQYRAYPNFTSINTKGHRTENQLAHMLCVTRLGPARRVERKSWIAPPGSLYLANRVTLPEPGLQFLM